MKKRFNFGDDDKGDSLLNLFFIFWIVGALIGFLFLCAIIYVGIHFLAKAW